MSFDGTYAISVFTGNGEKKDQFTIKTSGNKVTGVFNSAEMGPLPFSDVKVSGNTVAWTLYFSMPEGAGGPPGGGPKEPMKIPFKVTFEGNKVTGKLSMAGTTPFDVKGVKIS